MSDYRATIGLEIHAELKTRTKMFCACLNDPNEKKANTNICPVCTAHPGTLPVINKEAVHKVLLVGEALGSVPADFSEFDRKNYFYPDIPKGYQISQYQYPLVVGGSLRGVALTRIHLEEDTARSQHEGERSLVDYNRAGVPLMELVTEPVIHDTEAAGAFARELQLLLRYLGVGEANMEKGEMRVEANISVSNDDMLGTKVEVKNLNSFRSLERAIAYELERQQKLLEQGIDVVQETRGWDEQKEETFSQRKKESSHDYRYFPDPDVPKLLVSEVKGFTRLQVPELPGQRRKRYLDLGLKSDDVEMFVRDSALGDFFDNALAFSTPADSTVPSLLANYLASDIAGKIEKAEMTRSWLTAQNAKRFALLIDLVSTGLLSSRGAKDTLQVMIVSEEEPEVIARAKNLIQQSDEGILAAVAQKVIDAHPEVAADYKAGKEAALQFLVGQGMKETRGSANPQTLQSAIQKILS